MSEPQTRTEQFAALINSGLRPLDARIRMGLTKGQAGTILRFAKLRGLVADIDHSWFRKAQSAAATAMRDRIAEMAEQDIPLPEIAAALGISDNMVRKYWLQIRRGLGWQAV